MRKSVMMLALGALMLSGSPIFAQTITACVDARKGTLYISSSGCKVGDAQLKWNTTGATGPQGPVGPDGPVGSEGPQGPAGASAAGFVFVGFSAGTTIGDAGQWGMNLICQNSFGPFARMANAKEYILSNNTTPPTPAAWLNPFDFSDSIFSNTQLNCRNWNSDGSGTFGDDGFGNRGTTIDSSSIDGITRSPCNLLNQVACSGPAQVP